MDSLARSTRITSYNVCYTKLLRLDVTLSKVGGKGLFVKEIEQAMLDMEIDLAVHSMKDMPSELPEGLINGAIPQRVEPRDALISKEGLSLEELP